MSNALAIATVTQALALLIENNLSPEMDIAVKVETRKPPAEPPVEPTINVFLYQVTPNPSMRHTDLPTRASDGTLLKRPVAALDLHFLISAYGEEAELVGQRLIGCVVRTLHEIPVLPHGVDRTRGGAAVSRGQRSGGLAAEAAVHADGDGHRRDVEAVGDAPPDPVRLVGGVPGVAGPDRGPRAAGPGEAGGTSNGDGAAVRSTRGTGAAGAAGVRGTRVRARTGGRAGRGAKGGRPRAKARRGEDREGCREARHETGRARSCPQGHRSGRGRQEELRHGA